MGKVVKYCSSCDEGFAEKFGFCPNCGATLQAFEMSPVVAAAPPVVADESPLSAVEPTPVVAAPEPAPPTFLAETAPVAAVPVAEIIAAPVIAEFSEPVAPRELETEFVEPEPFVEPVAKPVAAKAAPVFVQNTPIDVDKKPASYEAEHDKVTSDGGFYVTVIEEKNARQRNLLLLGSLGFMVIAMMTATVYSLFAKDLEVGSINDDIFNAVIVDDVPTAVEEKKEQKKDNNAGGGGGGGREEDKPVNKGDMADQTPDPIRPPDVHIPKLDNPAIVLPPASTKGVQKFEKVYGQLGDPNGNSDALSNGQGSGGGVGSGRGTGQGSGNGLGAGSGNGSGYGGGNGNGNGNGTGDGNGGVGAPPPRPPVGVTQAIKILSKPRPGYTDSARQANIQGTVLLRVTFLASGQVGSISPVKGLGNGLTEQAIAAARRISFEPAKTNGVAQSVTKQIEYTFSIY